MAQDNGNTYVEEQEDGSQTICLDCWMEIENRAGRTFNVRPQTNRQTFAGRGGYVVGLHIRSRNTTIAGRGGGIVGLGVAASYRGGSPVGIGHGCGSITQLEVI
ncbi:hypothetical protein Tco_0295215 [Tanacetum coccineum]